MSSSGTVKSKFQHPPLLGAFDMSTCPIEGGVVGRMEGQIGYQGYYICISYYRKKYSSLLQCKFVLTPFFAQGMGIFTNKASKVPKPGG